MPFPRETPTENELKESLFVPRFDADSTSPGELQNYAVVRAPGEEIHRLDLGFARRNPVDLGRAQEQHAAFCERLRDHGVIVLEQPPLSNFPNSCLIRDSAVILDDPKDPVVLPAKFSQPARRGENRCLLEHLPTTFRPLILRSDDVFEGSDLVKWSGQTLVGWSPRTNHGGHYELQRIVRVRGGASESVPVRRANHLGSVLAGLDEESVLVSPLFVDTARAEKYELIPVADGELFCANMLPVADLHLVDDVGPKTRRMLESLGHNIDVIDLSEFRKVEAGTSDLALLFSSATPPPSL